MSNRTMMKNTTTDLPVMRSLARVRKWDKNPRAEVQGFYRGFEELVESIRMVGLQDAIHVWETPECDLILKGHRRYDAMKALGMTECPQIVRRFDDERDAFEYLLQDHGHTDPLDGSEKITAAQTALTMGLGADKTAAALGVNVERVQLWFQLGETMPAAAKRALACGTLSMNTAEELLKVDKADLGAAVQMVLRDEATGEPMSHGQAVAFIQSKYLRPAQWRRDWLALEPKLKKRLKVIDGHHYVPWDERGEFVQGETGQPWGEYQFADGYVPRDAEGRTWGEKAKALGATVYVVPAPRHEEKHVLLVSEKMVRAAESVAAPQVPNADGGMTNDEEDGPVEVTARTVETVDKKMEEAREYQRLCLGAIWEELAENPTRVMTYELWEPLLPFLCHLTTDVDAGALEAWQGPLTGMQLLDRVRADKKNRAPLRWAMILLLCAESDAADQPEEVMTQMAVALGVNIARLRMKPMTPA